MSFPMPLCTQEPVISAEPVSNQDVPAYNKSRTKYIRWPPTALSTCSFSPPSVIFRLNGKQRCPSHTNTGGSLGAAPFGTAGRAPPAAIPALPGHTRHSCPAARPGSPSGKGGRAFGVMFAGCARLSSAQHRVPPTWELPAERRVPVRAAAGIWGEQKSNGKIKHIQQKGKESNCWSRQRTRKK